MKIKLFNRRTYTTFLVFTLLLSTLFPSHVFASEIDACSECAVTEIPSVVHSHYDDAGNLVKYFDNNTEATYYEDGKIVIKDYGRVFQVNEDASVSTRSGGLLLLGKVIWTAIGVCSAIDYVTGHDLCRIALSYLGTNVDYGTYYFVSGEYVPGYIPRCEPRHSAPCNQGYWVYVVEKA